MPMDQRQVLAVLRDLQQKMEARETESRELHEKVTRLEQHNEQLREDSCVWQRECERLRGELASLQQQQTCSAVDSDSRNAPTWQQEYQRLQREVDRLHRENQRLRQQQDKQASGGCCCFHLFQALFGTNQRTPTTTASGERGSEDSTPTYYTNHSVRVS